MRITVSAPAPFTPRLFSKNDVRNGAEGVVQGLYGRNFNNSYLLKGPDFTLFIRPDCTMETAAACNSREWFLIKPTNELNISIS